MNLYSLIFYLRLRIEFDSSEYEGKKLY